VRTPPAPRRGGRCVKESSIIGAICFLFVFFFFFFFFAQDERRLAVRLGQEPVHVVERPETDLAAEAMREAAGCSSGGVGVARDARSTAREEAGKKAEDGGDAPRPPIAETDRARACSDERLEIRAVERLDSRDSAPAAYWTAPPVARVALARVGRQPALDAQDEQGETSTMKGPMTG